MKKTFLPVALVCAVLITSCRESAEKAVTTGSGDTAVLSANPVPAAKADSGNAAVDAIVKNYLDLKNALAEDKTGSAASAAEAMIRAIGEESGSGLDGKRQTVYQEATGNLKTHADRVKAASGDIDRQRQHFEAMSGEVEKLARNFTVAPLYKDFCPMAFDGKGATWLSETEEIHNPYFGARMQSCGEVREKL